jgi:membrane associated rhomboid family serine protease
MHKTEKPIEQKTVKEIRTDSSLFFLMLFKFLFYLLLIPFDLLYLLYHFLVGDMKKSSKRFNELIKRPFKIFKEMINWFFEAKVISFLTITLVFIYLLQVFVLGDFVSVLITHPSHLFSSKIYTLFTSLFLHADTLHLLGNVIALIIFGRMVERDYKNKTLWIFIIGGFTANLISHLISLYTGDIFFSLGASSGVTPLIMFAILHHPFALSSILLIPMPIFLIGWFLIYLDILGLYQTTNINNYAHLGGYFGILILSFFFGFINKKKVYSGLVINLLMLGLGYYIYLISF